MSTILTLLVLAGPTLVSFLLACVVGIVTGKRFYLQNGHKIFSGIFAAALFLLSFYFFEHVISFGIGLLFFRSVVGGDLLGVLGLVFGIYPFIFEWVLMFIGTLISVMAIYHAKRENISYTEPAPLFKSFMSKFSFVLILLALVTLVIQLSSVVELYKQRQYEKQEAVAVKQNQQVYSQTTKPLLQRSVFAIQAAIVTYEKDNNGKLPEDLTQLVPKYLTELPPLPGSEMLGGPYRYVYDVTDPTRNYYRLCAWTELKMNVVGLPGWECVSEMDEPSWKPLR